MVKDTEQINREQVEAWMLSPDHEIVPERGLCRLLKYKKDFGPDVTVKVDGAPLILASAGRPLMAHEVLPERGDLALDEDGNVLPQAAFTSRFQEWLGSFIFPEDTTLAAEPVPNVIAYVTATPDEFSESPGYVEIGYDPKLDQEVKRSESYDTEGRHMSDPDFGKGEEKLDSVSQTLVKLMLDRLPDSAVQEMLEKSMGAEVPIIGETGDGEELEVGSTTGSPVTSDRLAEVLPEMVITPCGKSVKKRGLAAHIRRCGAPACGTGSDNVLADPEANL